MAAIYGTLKRGNELLPNLNFSLRTLGTPYVWYSTDTDANGRFILDLPDGDFIIEGIWVGELNEWNVINYGFAVRSGKLINSSQLNINAKPTTAEIVETFAGDVTILAENFGDWIKTSARAYNGTYSFRSAVIGHNQTSTHYFIEIYAPWANPKLSFYYYLSTEANWDKFNVYLNETLILTDSGNKGWIYFETALEPNSDNGLRLEYSKDGSASYGEDAVYIDNIRLTYTPTTHTETAAETIGLTDTITPKHTVGQAPTDGWDVYRWDQAYFDIILKQHTVADNAALEDSLRLKTKKTVADTATVTEGFSKKPQSKVGDTTTLADAVRAKVRDFLDDTVSVDDSLTSSLAMKLAIAADTLNVDDGLDSSLAMKLGITTDTLSITDTIQAKAKLQIAEALSLLDTLAAAVKTSLSDSIGVSDDGIPRLMVVFQEAVAVSDSILALYQAVFGDSLAVQDLLANRTIHPLGDDAVTGRDNLTLKTTPSLNDTADLADAIATAVAAYRSDILILADQLAVTIKATQADTLDLLDDISSALTDRVHFDDTVALVDALRVKVAERQDDTVTLADDLATALTNRLSFNDAISLVDDIRALISLNAEDVLDILDNIAAAVGKNDLASATNLADDLANKVSPEAVAEILGLSDSHQLKTKPYATDTTAVADAIVKKVKDYLEDLITLVDSVKAKASDRNDDTAPSTDALAIVTKRLLTDTLTIADDIARAYGTGVLTPGTFDFGRFDEANFDNSGDYANLEDVLTIKQGYGTLGADLLALADAIQVAVKEVLADSVTVTDSTAAKVKDLVGDTVSLSDSGDAKTGKNTGDANTLYDTIGGALTMPRNAGDDVVGLADSSSLKAKPNADDTVGVADNDAAKNIGPGPGDTMGVGDTATFSFRKDVIDLLTLSDNLLRSVAAVVGDTLPVMDQLTLAAKAVAAEIVLNVADDNKLKAMTHLGDLMTLSDAHLSDLAKIHNYVLGGSWDSVEWDAGQFDGSGDYIKAEDNYRAAVATVLMEIIATNDTLSAKVKLNMGDNEGLTDGLLNQLTKVAAETMGVSDELLQLIIGLRKDTTLSLAELLSKRAGLPPDDSSAVADSIIAALTLARSADDLIAATDNAIAKVKAMLKDAAVLTDSLALSTKRAVEEAITVAEKLGLKTKRPVSSNGVGIIDELYLKYALGIAWDEEGVADSIRGKVKTLLQQVFINGVSIPVNGLNIRHSGNDRVSTATFRIHSPTSEVLNLAKQKAPVNIYLVDGVGNTDYFGGRIVGNPTNARGTITTEMEVTVDDWTAAAQDVYVIESFPENFGTIDEALRYLWSKYYGYSINLDKVAPTAKRMPSMVFNYLTLFDVTERLAQLLGWSWHVEWNGAERVLQFYPPSAAVQPVTLSREARNIVAGTARFGQDVNMANVVYVFGGKGLSNPYTQKIVADGQNTIYKLGSKPHRIDEGSDGGIKVTIVKPDGTRFNQTIGIMNLHQEEEFDVLLDFNEGTLRWRDENKPKEYEDGTRDVIEAIYRYTYPIMVQLTDENSIRQYGGKFETTINDSSLNDIVAARELGRAILRDRAHPKGFGSCEVNVPGLRAGQFITVDLPVYNTKGLFEITEIEKWIQGGTVRRRVTLNKADDAESRIAQRLKDFAKRLASLESSNRQEDLVVQRWLKGPANIGARVEGSVTGNIEESGASHLPPPTDDYILTWKTSGKSRTWATDKTFSLDTIKKVSKPRKLDTVATVSKISGGITFFDVHTFDDKSHPFGM
jgi:hypothetical protein